ncbi:MAG: hypothetical protein ACRD29_16950 [Acidimicrobiales bacterium]
MHERNPQMGRITGGSSEAFLRGPVNQWVDELSSLAVDRRVDTVIFWPDGEQAPQVRRFAEEIVPAVRAAVG